MISKVCIFGDSVAKGVVLDSVQKKYIFLKDSFARIISKKREVTVSNYAKFGCTVTKGLETVKRHADELCKYDYTVLEFGGNDCDYNWEQIAKEPQKPHLCNTPFDVFEQQYSEIIENVTKNGGNPVMLTLPPIDSKRYFAWVSKGLNTENILTFLGDVEHIHRWQGMYSQLVLKIAEKFGVPVIDIRSEFMKNGSYIDYLCEDGIHPNSKGHLLISDVIDRKIALLK